MGFGTARRHGPSRPWPLALPADGLPARLPQCSSGS